jgi:hypothetical protein
MKTGALANTRNSAHLLQSVLKERRSLQVEETIKCYVSDRVKENGKSSMLLSILKQSTKYRYLMMANTSYL